MAIAQQLPRERAAAGPARVRPRALVLGFLLCAACGWIIPYTDHYLQGTFLGGQHLPPGAVFVLLVMVLVVNPLVRLVFRRTPFTRGELLIVYAMLLVGTLIPGHGGESVFIPIAVSPFYYASPANRWEELFFQYLPPWLHPPQGMAVQMFQEGLSPGMGVPWGAWVVPLLTWSVMVVALYALAVFMSALLYPQWANSEKLTFPLVTLPLEMTQNVEQPFVARAFWGNPLMWLGAGIAVVVEVMRGIAFYYPQYQGLRMTYSLIDTGAMPEGPWRALGWSALIIYPSVIGISVLMRAELSGSLIAFHWINKLLRVAGAWLGYRGGLTIAGNPLWLGGQPWGGYFTYVGTGLWVARGHLGRAWRQLVGQEAPAPEQPMSYRTCLLGIGAALVVALGWLTLVGMSAWTAVAALVVYVVVLIILSKVVAETGMLFVQQTITPVQALNYFFGTQTVGARSLTAGMLFDRAFGTDLRSTPMPSFVQGLKIADMGRVDKRLLLWAVGLAIAGALPINYFRKLEVFYNYGAVNCNRWFAAISGTSGWDILTSWLSNPQGPHVPLLISVGVGAAVVFGLNVLRQRYLWFSLHPVGFIMMQTHPMSMMWSSIAIGWVLKLVLLKYGGARVLNSAIPFFLGLAFGDIVMMVFWLIVAAATGMHGMMLTPG